MKYLAHKRQYPLYDGGKNGYSIDQGAGGDREGKPVQESARKIENFEEKKMSNERNDGGGKEKQSARNEFESMLAENLELAENLNNGAERLKGLLFGVDPPAEKNANEKNVPPTTFFENARHVNVNIRLQLKQALETIGRITHEVD